MNESPSQESSSGESTNPPPPSSSATRAGGIDSTNPGVPLSGNVALPRKLGRYELQKQLGRGAMGTVYLAQDTLLGRLVALKVPQFSNEDDESLLHRFYQEARSAATLHHPNICPVHDVGEIDGVHYLTMAHLEGRPLSDVLGGGKAMHPRAAANLTRTLALALEEAHRHGIVHRDLKPANVMIVDKNKPVVMDFGLARQMADSPDSRLTRAGAIVGTPAYMSPEQVKSDLKLMGPGCDIYSLGVMLYEMLTGQLPFNDAPAVVMALILTQDPPPPREHRPKLDADIEAICLKAIAKRPENRYSSMDEFAMALTSYLKQHSSSAQTVVGMKTSPALGETAAEPSSPQIVVEPPPLAPQRKSRRRKDQPNRLKQAIIMTGVFLLGGALVYITVKPDADANGTGSAPDDGPAAVITDGIGIELALISPGKFRMGALESANGDEDLKPDDDELPRHAVEIKRPFYLGTHEVTQRQYEAVMNDNPSYHKRFNLPVENVTWHEAVDFCERLSRKEGKTYRLPTEAEWEFACRGETSTDWYFGNNSRELSEHGWYADNASGATHTTGQLEPNPAGLYDLYGNVSEWCQDWYDEDYYSASAGMDPQGPRDSAVGNFATKIVRGGDWFTSSRPTRSTYRGAGSPSARSSRIGFRVLREVD